MQLNLNNITYTYDDAVDPVFTSIHIVFPAGWSGVLGDNGCGKTTLALIAHSLIIIVLVSLVVIWVAII